MPIIEDAADILKTNATYDAMIDNWQFWGAAYEGDEEFLKIALKRHVRESEANYKLRLEEGEVFNYCATIVDIYAFFLSQVAITRKLGALEIDKLWIQFLTDVDLYGTNYDIFWQGCEKLSSVYGFVGVLIDKAPESDDIKTKEDELSKSVYPYYSLFIPENVLDWTFERNKETRRPELTYLKLKEADDTVLVWSKTDWERWEELEDAWEITETGLNPLGEIPFVWFTNSLSLLKPLLGVSDIRNVSRIQAAITRNLSQGSEVITYAAFPMLQKPYTSVAPTEEEDAVGVTAVLEFDPENPGAKAEWLESAVHDPISAILSWIEQKVDETYRITHLSSIHGQGTTKLKSGVTLKYEFQQLSAILATKGQALDEAELNALRFWGMWQNKDVSDADINRPTTFNIDDLSTQIDNILKIMPELKSVLLHKEVQKKFARLLMTDSDPELISQIEAEIDKAIIKFDQKDQGTSNELDGNNE